MVTPKLIFLCLLATAFGDKGHHSTVHHGSGRHGDGIHLGGLVHGGGHLGGVIHGGGHLGGGSYGGGHLGGVIHGGGHLGGVSYGGGHHGGVIHGGGHLGGVTYGGGHHGGLSYYAPAHYTYDYGVRDDYSGTNFGHTESRDGYKTQGKYYVHLPDGRIQVVSYYADEHGYHPHVSYEGVAHYPQTVHGGYH